MRRSRRRRSDDANARAADRLRRRDRRRAHDPLRRRDRRRSSREILRMRDGGLRALLVRNLPRVHFQSVETWSTGQGVPDLNYCVDGSEGWIELKKSDGWVVDFEPQQIAWLERRARAGGRVFVFVSRAETELYVLPASAARPLLTRRESLRTIVPIA